MQGDDEAVSAIWKSERRLRITSSSVEFKNPYSLRNWSYLDLVKTMEVVYHLSTLAVPMQANLSQFASQSSGSTMILCGWKGSLTSLPIVIVKKLAFVVYCEKVIIRIYLGVYIVEVDMFYSTIQTYGDYNLVIHIEYNLEGPTKWKYTGIETVISHEVIEYTFCTNRIACINCAISSRAIIL